MIAPLLFMQLGLAGTPTTISQVTAARDGGRLAITVNGDAAIDPEAARARMTDGHLYLFVQDARVREANRAWTGPGGDDAEPIRAHRHRHEVELVVPLAGSGCDGGSVELQAAPGGLQALISCARAAAPRPAQRPVAAAAPVAAKPAAPVAGPEKGAVELKAALVLDQEAQSKGEDKAEAKAADKAAPRPAPQHERSARHVAAAAKDSSSPPSPLPPVKAAATQSPGDRAPALAPAPVPAPPSLPGAAPPRAETAPAAAAKGPAAGNGGVFFAGAVLIALAGAAFFLTRKRAKQSRLVRIVESTSLGPKRSIVVARVGGSTMILGSSEAGITLLQTLPGASMGAAAPMPKAPMPKAPATAAVAGTADATPDDPAADAAGEPSFHIDVVEDAAEFAAGGGPTVAAQGGLLARLFHRARPANDASAPASPRFEDLLQDSLRGGLDDGDEDGEQDSFEDQELRRKLSLGLAGRVR